MIPPASRLDTQPKCVLPRLGAAHLVKTFEGSPGWTAIGYLDGRMEIVAGDHQRWSLDVKGNILDADIATRSGRTLVGIATSESALIFELRASGPQELANLTGHEGRVTAIALGAEPRAPHCPIVSTDERGNIHIWDPVKFMRLASKRLHRKAVHTLHCSTLASNGGAVLLTGSDDRDLVVFNLDSSVEVRRLNSHFAWVEQVRVPLGAQSLRWVVVVDRVGTIVWDVDTGRPVARVRGRPTASVAALEHPSTGMIVAIPGRTEVAVWSPETFLRLPTRTGGEVSAATLTRRGAKSALWWAEGATIHSTCVGIASGLSTHDLPGPVSQIAPSPGGSGIDCILEDGSMWRILE